MKTTNIVAFDQNKIPKNQLDIVLGILNEFNAVSLSRAGGETSARTEERFRAVLGESRPSTNDYDFASGENTFFGNIKVELKQCSGNNYKFQQVKPHLYDKVLMVREDLDRSTWFVISTSLISSYVKVEGKEPGKMLLSGQHKGNLNEGMLLMDNSTVNFTKGKTSEIVKNGKDMFSDLATLIGVYPPIDYSKDDLGLTDQEIFGILEFVKNH